jgi:hypothetical protein
MALNAAFFASVRSTLEQLPFCCQVNLRAMPREFARYT